MTDQDGPEPLMAAEDGGGPAAGYRDFPMPGSLGDSARAWLDGAAPHPTPARPSATVMLLRERAGTEVFVLRRASTMRFAPDFVAFPGGGVDPRDSDPDVPWAGPRPQDWSVTLDTDQDRARKLVIAAAREVFEECGVLLAGGDDGTVVADLTGPAWDIEREALLAHEQSFGELLIRRRLVLRSDLLRLRGHWITPDCEPRRYDTRFFAARMPEGQVADDRSTEATRVRWVHPGAALADHRAGTEVMLPPTQVMLEQLAAAVSVQEFLDRSRPVSPVQPWPVEHDGALWMRAPVDGAGHGRRSA
jgi:8-oxo-dGTP pyrophosphatase MutT (NUDIX family)